MIVEIDQMVLLIAAGILYGLFTQDLVPVHKVFLEGNDPDRTGITVFAFDLDDIGFYRLKTLLYVIIGHFTFSNGVQMFRRYLTRFNQGFIGLVKCGPAFFAAGTTALAS